jgi:NodT family efflux transporter outer membrane factor (OMF) lipoprotein
LRSRSLGLICLFFLSGCVNYAGIHSNARPLDDSMLDPQHPDNKASQIAAVKPTDWWRHFNNPQLNSLISTALENSPSLQIAEARVAQAEHLAQESDSALWPSLNADASIAREHISPNTIFPPPYGGNNYTETNIGLNFQYEFDFWGKNRQALESYVSRARASAADYGESRLVLAAEITTTYFQLQASQAKMEIAKAILKQEQSLLDIITTRATHGIESDIPVTTANSEMQAARIQLDNSEQQIKIYNHQLAALMGKSAFDTNIVAAKLVYNAKLLKLPAVIPANLLGQRPDLVASRWRVEAAAHQVNSAKARFYPNINLNAFLSLESYALNKAFWWSSRDNLVGTAIDLPIFDAGLRRANLGERYAEYDNAVASYNQTIVTGIQQVADQLTTLHTLATQEAAQNASVKALKNNYNLTRLRYRHGIVDYTQVLESQGQLLQQQNYQLQLEALHLKSMVALIKALGGSYTTSEG